MKRSQNIMSIFLEGAAGLYIILMLGFFPLFYQDNFIDISSAKLSFFFICTTGMIGAMALFAAMGRLQQMKEKIWRRERAMRRENREQNKNERHMGVRGCSGAALRQWLSGITSPTWFAVLFAVGLLVATWFSANPMESLMGREGRKLGLLIFLLCIAVYGLIGTYLKPALWMVWVFFGTNAIVCLLAVLNFWGIDPLGMYKNLILVQHESFTSTIGNTNNCSSYLCMVMPAGMVCYMLARDRLVRVLSGAFVLLGFMACYSINSESWIPGIGVVFLVLMWFSMSEQQEFSAQGTLDSGAPFRGAFSWEDTSHRKMRRFLELCGLFWISSVWMKLLFLAGNAAGVQSPMFLAVMRNKLLSGVLLNGYVLAVVGILLAGAVWFVNYREKRKKALPYTRIRNGFFLVCAVAAGFGLLLLAVANFKPDGWQGAFAIWNSLRIQDTFGSGRGAIWRITVEAWLKLPLWDKLTGYGLNCFHMFIQQYSSVDLSQMFGGSKLVDAHNEFLQFLVTTGLLGTIGYFGLLISTAVRAARKCASTPALLLGVAVSCGYLAQSMINNSTVLLAPYLFLMLGIIKSMEKMEDV